MIVMPGFERGVPTEQTKDIYAIRRFTYDCYGDIVGLTYRQPILKGVNQAQCGVRKDHQVPEVDCSCGFYCFDSYENEGSWMQNYQNFAAVVKVSGRVLVCPEGLRAERIEIVAVHDRVNAANELGVPNYTDFEIMKSEFPLAELERVEKVVDEPEPAPVLDLTKAYSKPSPKDLFRQVIDGSVRFGKAVAKTASDFAKNTLPLAIASAVLTVAFFMVIQMLQKDISPEMYAMPTAAILFGSLIRRLNKVESAFILFSAATSLIIFIFVKTEIEFSHAVQFLSAYSAGMLIFNLLPQRKPKMVNLAGGTASTGLTTAGHYGYDNRRLPARLSNNSEGR